MIKNKKTHAKTFSVGIVGCGWLGKALAASLLEQGVSVLATSSQQGNVEQLHEQGIKAQQLLLPSNTTQLSQHDVFTQQYLVIAITPQFKQGRTDYAIKVAQLVEAAKQRGVVQRIILLSSTAVYQGLEGLVDENTKLNLEEPGSVKPGSIEKAPILNRAEQAVLNFHRQGNVLRLAGLVGPARHPGKFLLAKRALKNSTAPVNLIHQQDAVGLILSLLTSVAPQGVFNGVSDTHITKALYYQTAAKSLGLELPTFSVDSILDSTRIVSGDKAKQELGYSFIYPDLLAWLYTRST
ncbi:NAD-dependent epimerase/dehydratase family protein [Candidatus Colwellia aromaticivorans]|uniref:NAD-dependent epimerase/dehydratase family protein n=1 Tax=Candidatus Colwellia aromaticivorans TaxID=2267621 RepID=UPI000DF373BF|nr:NAD-dependent epimerase/dehydratase family protein [Candidatus Colwellia aromaticivorans]